MGRYESVTNPPTPGAGRRFSWRPVSGGGPQQNAAFAQPMTNVASRASWVQNATASQFVITGAPPGTKGAQIYKGAIAYGLTSDSTPTGYTIIPNFTTNNPYCAAIQTVKSSVNFKGIDDYWCWSFSCIAAFDALPGAVTGDVGLVLSVGTRANIRGTSQFTGLEFGPTGTGTIGVFVRTSDGGPVTFNANIANPPDMTEYHKWEIRLLGPTNLAEACVKCMIDGQTKQQLNYGAGTVLFPQDSPLPNNNQGYTFGIINLNASAAGQVKMYIIPESITISAAPDESSLA